MFTGLIEGRSPIERLERSGGGARLVLPAPDPSWTLARGDSVSVSGCCLTVVELTAPGSGEPVPDGTPGATGHFDLSRETLERTWFAEARGGELVNLERPLRLGDRLGGHLVSGHVDGLGRVLETSDPGDGGLEALVEVDPGLERYLIEKGSIALDGVSLTVCRPEGRRLRVALIPETLRRTNLEGLAPGRKLHVEADQVGKWIERLFPGVGEAAGR